MPNRKTILIVEDNPLDQTFLASVVTDLSLKNHIAGTAASGLHILESNPCAAILLDLILPNGAGVEVLLRFRSRFPLVPVVVITQLDVEQETLLRAGAMEVLRKPAGPEAIKHALSYAIARNEYLSTWQPPVQKAVGEIKQEAVAAKQELAMAK